MKKIKEFLVKLLKKLNLSILIRHFSAVASVFNRFYGRVSRWFSSDSSSNGDLFILCIMLYAVVVSSTVLLWCILLLF